MSLAANHGYRLTDIGLLPVDWEIRSLGEIANVSSGGTPSRDNKKYWGGNVPWVTTALIDGNEIECAEEFITELGVTNSAAKWFRKGTILMAMYGQGKTRGKVGLLGIDATINQACAGISLNDREAVPFIFHYLKSQYESIRRLSNSGGQENLSGSIVKSMQVPMPCREEQQAIATALIDMDALISGLDQLIAKKRDIKQATMQQLLTGQTRLPGFSGEWEVKRLGDVLSVRHGKNQHSVEVCDGRYPILATGGEIGRTDSFLYDKPSVLIGRKGTIDRPVYREEPFWTVDTLFYTEISGTAHPKFIYYKFLMIDWRSYSEASGVPSLNASTIEAVAIDIPCLTEQIAIATILSDMDTELATLEARRDKAKRLKQGMMQELLTGRTRLI